MAKPPQYIAEHLRTVLKNGGSAPHTAEVQQFFKEVITSRGWYTHELRKLARRFTKVIKGDAGLEYLTAVADELFRGDVLEEKILAVQLLESSVDEFKVQQFALFEQWLDRVSTWADHDALVSYLIGPMVADSPRLIRRVLRWAKSKDRWHRRAAAVALVRGARRGMFEPEVAALTARLLNDDDLMVRKGLGWLLREYVKFNRKAAMPLVTAIRGEAPRLVLRTACETLPPALRRKMLETGGHAGTPQSRHETKFHHRSQGLLS